jgi:uncharacterized protein (DUF1330 family)
MAAYLIVEIAVTDTEVYKEYQKLVGPTLEKYGGRFLVRGGNIETIEGDWRPQRVVIVEFTNVEQARKWYYSPEYTLAKAMRQKATNTRMLLVQGL